MGVRMVNDSICTVMTSRIDLHILFFLELRNDQNPQWVGFPLNCPKTKLFILSLASNELFHTFLLLNSDQFSNL